MSGVTPATRALVLDRDGWTCQLCGRGLSPGDYSLQHRRARGMGGSRAADTNTPSNLVALCGSGTTGCHGRIEAHPKIAAELGYRVRQGARPADVAIVTHTNGVVRLLDDGTTAPPHEREP